MNNTPLSSITPETIKKMPPKTLRTAGDICFAAGFASIAASIIAWGARKGTSSDSKAERLGIFIGLWAPTFFILSDRLERYADRAEQAGNGLIDDDEPIEGSVADESPEARGTSQPAARS